MNSVYLLWHMHALNGDDDEKLIGVYRSGQDAKTAIEGLKNKPGFIETHADVLIEEYELNRDHWEKRIRHGITVTDFDFSLPLYFIPPFLHLAWHERLT